MSSYPMCPMCRGFLYFTTDWIGHSMQTCRCGTRPMEPHRMEPVIIPPDLMLEEGKYVRRAVAARVEAVCRVCRTVFMTSKLHPGRLCTERCRKRWRKIRDHHEAVLT